MVSSLIEVTNTLKGINRNLKNKPAKKDTFDFIYTPSINLYVAKERTLQNKNWFEKHRKLQSNKERMLIIPEFGEFIKYLKSKPNNQEYQRIYKDITEVREPLRAECFDADFKVINEKLHVNYNHILDSNGKLIPKNSEFLDSNTLMKDKTPGIDLEDWIYNSHTAQGFPTKNVKSGRLHYYNPLSDNNSAAGFYVGNKRAGFDCSWSPSSRDWYFGVRACKAELA